MTKITIPTEKTASNDDGSSKASSSPSSEQLDSFPMDIESVTNELSNDVSEDAPDNGVHDDVAAANDSAVGRGVKKNDDHGGEEREDFASSNPTMDATNNDDDGGEDATMDGAKIDGNNGKDDNIDTLEQQQRDEAPSPKVDEVIGGDLAVDDDEEEDAGEDTEIVANDDDGDDEEEGEEQQWELTKIMTIKELNKKKPMLCDYSKEENGGTCQLVACSKWKDTKGDETWFSCLDCQQG